ncbi:SIS domain-containing protein [Candidatus Woesearchaeota archaeon]|nr:SIS domain-containing protein [Candidatus Woesearchaeota archaeon]
MVKTDKAKDYVNEFIETLKSADLSELNKIIDILEDARRKGKQIFVMGNGGSASIASHFATDLGKGTVKDFNDDNEKRFRIISLADNIPLMTAYSNDLGYEHVFSEQLKNLVQEGDIVIGISSSGKSRNVINAINLAKKMKAKTIGLVGFDGGQLKNMVDFKILVKKNDYGMVEDAHSMIQHLICSILKERIKS